MMISHKTKTNLPMPEKVDMSALWEESMQDVDFQFEIKAQSVAVGLVRATSELGLSQADLAARLNWKPSRVSKVLHGSTNITLRTLFEITRALNLDFDVIYHRPGAQRPSQPWDTDVMIDKAVAACKRIEELQRNTEENLTKSESILETARALNRKSWCRANFVKRSNMVVQHRTAVL